MTPLSPNQRRAAVAALWAGLTPAAGGAAWLLLVLGSVLWPPRAGPAGFGRLDLLDDVLVLWGLGATALFLAAFGAALRFGFGLGWTRLQALAAVAALMTLAALLGAASGAREAGLMVGMVTLPLGWLGLLGVGVGAVGGASSDDAR